MTPCQMMRFEIVEVDRDYRTVTGTEIKEFESKQAADDWCREASWTGYRYWASSVTSQESS